MMIGTLIFTFGIVFFALGRQHQTSYIPVDLVRSWSDWHYFVRRRNREKRKNEQKLLEDELAELQAMDNHLRQLIKQEIPTQAQTIFKICCADHPLHQAPGQSVPKQGRPGSVRFSSA